MEPVPQSNHFPLRRTARRAFLACLLLASANFAASPHAEDAPEARFAFFETAGYSTDSPAEKKTAVFALLGKTDASVIVLSGLKDSKALDEIRGRLKGYEFSTIVEAADPASHICMISKVKPEKCTAVTDLKYEIEKTELPVEKGLLHAVFKLGNYRLHLVSANLKDRVKHPQFNQTDMRRYEARQLRYYVTDIIKKDKEANILVLGNMNDTCGMSPIKDIYNRRFDVVKRLFDIRPLDGGRTSWTSWNPATDDYERIDYAIGTSGLLPEIVRDKTLIVDDPAWAKASGHRPLLVTVRCRDEEKWTEEKLAAEYPNTIYEGPACHFEDDKAVGDKPLRNPPRPP